MSATRQAIESTLVQQLKYISPSAYRAWNRDREEFYLNYLATYRLQKQAQAQAAAIGSAFDARVKSSLALALLGTECPASLTFDPLFTSQVGEAHRDWALQASEYAFRSYVTSGRYTELLYILQNADGAPEFEGRIYRDIPVSVTAADEHDNLVTTVTNVPVLGLPDLHFRSRSGFRIVLDWKVKGFCSTSAKSPTKLYVMCRDGWSQGDSLAKHLKPSRGAGQPHKNAVLTQVDDLVVHEGWFEDADTYYANQLAMYLWVLGEEPASSNHVVVIDELVCKPNHESSSEPGHTCTEVRGCNLDGRPYPLIRVATIAARVSNAYQQRLLTALAAMWNQLQTGHIFDDRTREASDAKCKELDALTLTQSPAGNAVDAEFGAFVRSQFRFGY